MRINAANAYIINPQGINLHDCILEGIRFDRIKKELCLEVLDNRNAEYSKGRCSTWIGQGQHSILFRQVIGLEMTACDFWGMSPYIFDFEYTNSKDSPLIAKLFAEIERGNYDSCCLKSRAHYFQTTMTFSSGDRLTIASGQIEI